MGRKEMESQSLTLKSWQCQCKESQKQNKTKRDSSRCRWWDLSFSVIEGKKERENRLFVVCGLCMLGIKR
jgi:hypothetical protein